MKISLFVRKISGRVFTDENAMEFHPKSQLFVLFHVWANFSLRNRPSAFHLRRAGGKDGGCREPDAEQQREQQEEEQRHV